MKVDSVTKIAIFGEFRGISNPLGSQGMQSKGI